MPPAKSATIFTKVFVKESFNLMPFNSPGLNELAVCYIKSVVVRSESIASNI